MLASITPLGERGRGARWSITVTAFVSGSTLAGGAFGLVLGTAGMAVGLGRLSASARTGVAAILVLVGTALDNRLFDLSLPTVRRQVNEEWLEQYRNWVYGLGFGVQLGLGVMTIVTTSSVYTSFLVSLLAASPIHGLLVGSFFGLARASTVFASATVRRPEQVAILAERLRLWARPIQLGSVWTQVTLALGALILLLR